MHNRILTGALMENTSFALRKHYRVSAMDSGLIGLGSNNIAFH